MNTLTTLTPVGEFSLLLHAESAPETCRYFRNLVRKKALDAGFIFRITSEKNQRPGGAHHIHIVQAGAAKKLSAERRSIAHESTRMTGLAHKKWTVSAARFDPGEVYGSFFVCMRDEPELDYGGSRQDDGAGYAAFGKLVSGFDTLQKIFARSETNEMLDTPIPIRTVTSMDASRRNSGNLEQ